jgi:hypothetical protein
MSDPEWKPWNVAPDSGFEVHNASGKVGLVQVGPKHFTVTDSFRFRHARIVGDLEARAVGKGDPPMDEAAAKAAVADATLFRPREVRTDLASIPRFMRWFESSYGSHTLAAIIHDELIVEKPNQGALKSDTLADRFFRQMMRAAGVKPVKAWVMWAAVALRTRWAAGGIRRASVILWLLLAGTGITAAGWWLGTSLWSWRSPVDARYLLLVAVVLPAPSALLWGKQRVAAAIATAMALPILPAAVLAATGYGVYSVIELLASRFGPSRR